jgi:hypothetical protein
LLLAANWLARLIAGDIWYAGYVEPAKDKEPAWTGKFPFEYDVELQHPWPASLMTMAISPKLLLLVKTGGLSQAVGLLPPKVTLVPFGVKDELLEGDGTNLKVVKGGNNVAVDNLRVPSCCKKVWLWLPLTFSDDSVNTFK